MRLIPLAAALALGLMLGGPAPAATPPAPAAAAVSDYSQPGPYRIGVVEGEWKCL